MSQTIHDTTAQWAYMVSLGVQGAMELVDESDEAVMDKLRLVAVLEAHAETFTVITSVPAELVQHGHEPPMSTINRSLLFSIAHNALTNVIRHAGATRVAIGLDCTGERLRLSVSDDGAGLPEDYEGRGHGFRNMQADAERMGGVLDVKSKGDGGGTTVACVVPFGNLRGGD